MAFREILKSTVSRTVNAPPADVADANVNAWTRYYLGPRDCGKTYRNMRHFLGPTTAVDASNE